MCSDSAYDATRRACVAQLDRRECVRGCYNRRHAPVVLKLMLVGPASRPAWRAAGLRGGVAHLGSPGVPRLELPRYMDRLTFIETRRLTDENVVCTRPA